MKSIKVANISDISMRLAARLADNPSGIPVKVGWDGRKIAVYSGTYAAPAKYLPHACLRIGPFDTVPEIETSLALAVAGLLRKLPAALASRGTPARASQGKHYWKRGGDVDRGGNGD